MWRCKPVLFSPLPLWYGMSITDSILMSVLLPILCHNSDINTSKIQSQTSFCLVWVFLWFMFFGVFGFRVWFVLLWLGFFGLLFLFFLVRETKHRALISNKLLLAAGSQYLSTSLYFNTVFPNEGKWNYLKVIKIKTTYEKLMMSEKLASQGRECCIVTDCRTEGVSFLLRPCSAGSCSMPIIPSLHWSKCRYKTSHFLSHQFCYLKKVQI